jgi:hypothetical protein
MRGESKAQRRPQSPFPFPEIRNRFSAALMLPWNSRAIWRVLQFLSVITILEQSVLPPEPKINGVSHPDHGVTASGRSSGGLG